jgi:phosphoglycolate phosphatase
MVGAGRNGVGAYGVLWGYGTRMELERAGAVCCLGSPADLAARFR